MTEPHADRLANVVIVLDQPKRVVNIAGVVRAMMNMGLSRLRLVNPDDFDVGRIEGIAHRSRYLLDSARIFETLPEAVADAVYVVGTSARARSARINAAHPRTLSPRVVARARDGLVAVMLGREDRGLSNEALDLCHEVAVIPTGGDFPSLNLAQACLVMCYEILLAGGSFAPETSLGRGKRVRVSPPATQGDLEEMYTVLERGLDRMSFFSAREPVAVMRALRTLLGRARPSLREAQLVRAIGYEIGNCLDRLQHEDGDER